ncbi:MAG: YdcF family protein [Pseudohaliea sp.]
MWIDKLAIALLAPLGTSLALAAVALLLAAARRRRLAGLAGVLAFAWLFTWSLAPVSHALRGMLEDDYPYRAPLDAPRAPVAVVLGGGIDPPGTRHGPANLNAAADRVLYAAELYHAGRVARLLLSGGASPGLSARSEAAVTRELLLALAVPADAILLEEESRNTRQNAAFTARLLRERGIDRILLVTSALHMRRALARFEAQGLDVIPAATDHEARDRFTAVDWLPDAEALDGAGRALKEIAGYRTGR